MVVVNKAKEEIKNKIKQFIIDDFNYIGIGTGTTAATESDTALETELLRLARFGYDEDVNSVTVNAFLSATQGNGSALTEVGTFKEASAGDMYSRDVDTVINKTQFIEVWYEITAEYDAEINYL